MMRPSRLFVLALLGVGACGPLVQIGGNAKPPQSLLMLTATAAPRAYAGPSKTGDTVAVSVPVVPGALQTLRLPVVTTNTEVTYLVGAIWSEQPAKQFQRLLVDTLSARGLAVLDRAEGTVAPARLVSGTLREFGLDVRDAASPTVHVRYDAQLTGRPGQVALRRFDVAEPAQDQSPVAVAAALNRAANKVAGQVADWVAS